MKKDRILRLCVTAALMAGGVWAMGVPGVDAKNFDMTSGKYANGITYTDPDSDVGTASDPNCYNYKYEASTGKVIGGNIKVESNENNLNFYTALRISKSDVAGLDVTDQKKVLKLLAEKYVTSSNVYADWDYATKKFAYVQIVDDTGKGDPQVLRSYKIKWRSYSNEISNVDEQVSGVYTTTIRNDGTGNTEYDFSKDGTWYKSGAAIDINIKPEKSRKTMCMPSCGPMQEGMWGFPVPMEAVDSIRIPSMGQWMHRDSPDPKLMVFMIIQDPKQLWNPMMPLSRSLAMCLPPVSLRRIKPVMLSVT